jgi:5-methyltetrahydrofolate--homocysteine methyltransferase
LEETASDEDFEAYLDYFFRAVAPGKRIIAGIADTTPPNAVFDRLVRIGERIQKEGRLPLEAGTIRPMIKAHLQRAADRVSPHRAAEKSYQTVYEDVLRGDHQAIQEHVKQLLDEGHDARAILNQGMLSAMEVIGERFKTGEVFIPEVLLSARAMNEALKVLEPYLASGEGESSGKILIGTVRGDLHDIGKNMVSTMLRGVGFEIRDLGINVPTEEFVRQVADYKPDILGLSALLTTTMPEMKRVIDALQAEGLRNDVKVMVGGAPVNERFAQEIGADGYAPDAGEAVALAKRLIQGP